MSKKLLILCVFLLVSYTIPCIAQDYDKKIQITITIKDKVSEAYPFEVIQLHKLSFNDNDFIYDINEHVGFEINVDNQSESGKVFNYILSYAPYNYNASEDDLTRGGLKPVTIPPIEDCEDDDDEDCECLDEDQFASTPQTFPFTPINEAIDLTSSQLGSGTVSLYLTLDNQLVSQISHPFKVISGSSKSSENNVSLYPNPLDTYLYIQLEEDKNNRILSQNVTNNHAIIEVYTMQGILLKKSHLSPLNNDFNTTYRFTNPSLKRGTYVYKITIDGHEYSKIVYKR